MKVIARGIIVLLALSLTAACDNNDQGSPSPPDTTWTLPKLPPGEYQVEIWHPLRGNRVVAVTVPKRGDVTCDLAF